MWEFIRDNTKVRLICFLAVLILVLVGVVYRVSARREPINLPVSLKMFPLQIGNWTGSDLPIPATTKEYMENNFADDYFSRRYVNSSDKNWADVYVVYCSTRPGGMLGHRPGVCYPANGWQHESTEKSQFVTKAGWRIDCLVQRFRQPENGIGDVVVLSFYVLNGRMTAKESDFSGLFSRKFNVTRDQSKYVAQVQISSVLESSVRRAAEEMTDVVFDFLPDENGKVKAASEISVEKQKR